MLGGRVLMGLGMLAIIIALMLTRMGSMDHIERKVILPIVLALVAGGVFYYLNGEYRLLWDLSAPATPPAEQQFLAAIDEARGQAEAAADAAQQKALLAARTTKLCAAVGHGVTDWTGRVEQTLFMNGEEKATLSVRISRHVLLRTAFTFDDTGTLIDARSPFFATLPKLQSGDVVRFSGEFVPSPGACLTTGNMDEDGRINEPEFILRFTAVGRD